MKWFKHYCYFLLASLIAFALIDTQIPMFAEEINFGKYHALLIANQNYKLWKSLKTPLADVNELSVILKNRYRFSDIKILLDATREQIVDSLEGYRKTLSSNDSLLIYYAGHGKLRKDGGYWIGVDAQKDSRSRWLHYSTISDLIDSDNGMKARHVLVIADSCYSGALTRNEGENTFAQKHPGEKDLTWLFRMNETTSRTALTSGGTEPVIDRAGTATHSIFSQELIRILKSNIYALQTKSIYNLISKDVHARALRVVGRDAQAPQYDLIPGTGHSGGDFLFVLSDCVLQVPQANIGERTVGIRGDTTPFSAQQIRQIQERLHQMGFDPGPANGVLGHSTSEALRHFQASEGLPATGVLNGRTADMIAKTVDQPHQTPSHNLQKDKKKLRDKPKKISENDAKQMFKSQGFFDVRWNRIEIVNNYYLDNENGTVTDLTTGLIWQKGGSLNALTWPEAESYTQSLNNKNYAGLSNWRVPTIEELASLIQSNHDGNLYLSPLFDKLQAYCWSSDYVEMNFHWISHFSHGLLYYNNTDKECFVKAVCSTH